MSNSIRWLLTESRLTSLDPNKVNFVDGKLICYHLTSKSKWIDYNENAALMDSPNTYPDRDILPTDTRAQTIIKRITNDKKNVRPQEWEIEEFVITDMIYDPYTDTSGFMPGGGDYHGKGLYTCYKFNPLIAHHYGNICLVFEIDISNFLITFEDLAKKVHGENWRIKDQLMKLYQIEERSLESIEKYKQLISKIPDSHLEMGKSLQDSDRTANISQTIIEKVSRQNVMSFYDGVILFGENDGPVCVSFLPKYDAKLIGLGRVNRKNPEIVDWYDSLNDFLGGRAKLKQDFKTINAIAKEITDPAEKEAMKSADRLPFDMEYLDITNFFRTYSYTSSDNPDKLFSLYEKINASGDTRKIEFFLKTFEASRYSIDKDVMCDPRHSKLSDEVIRFYKSKSWDIGSHYYTGVLNVYNKNNLKVSDFFLENAINESFNESLFRTNQGYKVVQFKKSLDAYLEVNELSNYIQKSLEEKLYQIGPEAAVESNNAKNIVDAYIKGDELNKNKIIQLIIDSIQRPNGKRNWASVASKDTNFANELLEKVIKTISNKMGNSYRIKFIEYMCEELNDVYYFSNTIDEFLAKTFVDNITKFKLMQPRSLFVNTFNYIKRKLDESHPAVLQAKEFVEKDAANVGRDTEEFVEKLKLGKVGKSQLSKKFIQFQDETSYITYISNKTKDWFKVFVKAVINNCTINQKFKILGKKDTGFLLAIIMSHDIVLTKDEQIAFANKIGKSDYGGKNTFASYRHIDPDVFINLIGPDLKAGGMGPGLTFQGFEYTPNIYRLLYNHRKIVDLFCDVARPGLMKMIVVNLNSGLIGDANLRHTWAQSGKLKGPSPSYYHGTLPYIHDVSDEIKISEAVNMDDISWFEYFVNRSKTSPKRGVAKAIAVLEKNLNDKKSKIHPTTTAHPSDDLDPKLSLDHRKIVGNTLKEVYNMFYKGRNK